MPTLTIRNLAPDVIERIKRYAQENGRSMEQEARDALSRRFATRNAILDQIEADWQTLPYKPSAAKVQEWIANARKGRPGTVAAMDKVIKARKRRQGGKP